MAKRSQDQANCMPLAGEIQMLKTNHIPLARESEQNCRKLWSLMLPGMRVTNPPPHPRLLMSALPQYMEREIPETRRFILKSGLMVRVQCGNPPAQLMLKVCSVRALTCHSALGLRAK